MSSQAVTPEPNQRSPMNFNTRALRVNFTMRKVIRVAIVTLSA